MHVLVLHWPLNARALVKEYLNVHSLTVYVSTGHARLPTVLQHELLVKVTVAMAYPFSALSRLSIANCCGNWKKGFINDEAITEKES